MNGTTTKITPEQLEAEIASERYFTALEGVMGAYGARGGVHPHGVSPSQEEHANLALLTFCVLVLRNGCKVVGVNHGPVDPAGFDEAYGRKDAREDAIRQVWQLLGFRLRDTIHSRAKAADVAATIDQWRRPSCACEADESCRECRPVLTTADAAADLAGLPRPS